MKTIKTKILAGIGMAMLCMPMVAFGAPNASVAFDQGTGKLSISGNCSARFVLIVIRRSSDGSVWGSSNPDCVKGSYSYNIVVPASDRTGATFIVDAVDGGTTAPAIGAPAAGTVTFSQPAPTVAPTIVIDTSSLAAAPEDDGSFLDNALQNFFGIITSAIDAVRTSVVAAMKVFSKMFAVLPGGSITVPKGTDQMAGEGWISAGVTDVFVPDAIVASSSEIIVTPSSPTDVPLAVTQKIDGQGFHVAIAHPQSAPISFAWLIVQTYSVGAPTVAEQSVSFGSPSSPSSAIVSSPADSGANNTSDVSTGSGPVASDTTSNATDSNVSNANATSTIVDPVATPDPTPVPASTSTPSPDTATSTSSDATP